MDETWLSPGPWENSNGRSSVTISWLLLCYNEKVVSSNLMVTYSIPVHLRTQVRDVFDWPWPV